MAEVLSELQFCLSNCHSWCWMIHCRYSVRFEDIISQMIKMSPWPLFMERTLLCYSAHSISCCSMAQELVPKKTLTPVIRNLFRFSEVNIAQTTVICKICKDKVWKLDGNTTNLFNHLKRIHLQEFAGIFTLLPFGVFTYEAPEWTGDKKNKTLLNFLCTQK